jgi:hypothetical protein
MAIEIGIQNKEHNLKPGMYATAALSLTEHTNAITVPTQTILNDNSGTFVYILQNNTARRTPVQLGIERNSRTEILAGLTGAENIITTGQQFVRDGGTVVVQQ